MGKKIFTIQSADKNEFDKKVNSFLDLGFELHDNGYQVIVNDKESIFSQVIVINTNEYDILIEDEQIKYICPLNEIGNRNGKYIGWDSFGNKNESRDYLDGIKLYGRRTTREGYEFIDHYYENGEKKREERFLNGDFDGINTKWYKNGYKKIERNYRNGVDDGVWTEWYKNGQKSVERFHKNDKSIKTWSRWSENGNKIEEITFNEFGHTKKLKNFKEDGSTTEHEYDSTDIVIKKTFNKINLLVKEETFKNGNLVSAKEWNEDGSLKS